MLTRRVCLSQYNSRYCFRYLLALSQINRKHPNATIEVTTFRRINYLRQLHFLTLESTAISISETKHTCAQNRFVWDSLWSQHVPRNIPRLATVNTILKRFMGGGPRNEEHNIRIRAIRKARKVYFKSLPERPPKPMISTKYYDDLCSWKSAPISKQIEHRVVHICSFIIYSWLITYPMGASLRKLQRDIAFRMQRKHRLPGKLPYQIIMPIVGKLERENYLKVRMKSNGHCLIYRDNDVNIVPDEQYGMDALSRAVDDDESQLDLNQTNGSNQVAITNPEWKIKPYAPPSYTPVFNKQQKPKMKKTKTRKKRDRSNPVMDKVDLPPNTEPTSRGPRYVPQV